MNLIGREKLASHDRVIDKGRRSKPTLMRLAFGSAVITADKNENGFVLKDVVASPCRPTALAEVQPINGTVVIFDTFDSTEITCALENRQEEGQMPRELIEPRKGDKRFVRRGKRGQFKEVDDVGRSLAADRRKKAKKVAKRGEGDKGDRPARKKKRKAKRKSS